MKVLGLGKAETFSQKFRTETERLHWDGVLVKGRTEFIQALRQFGPDLVYIEANGLSDLEALKEIPFPIQAPIVAFSTNMTEDFLVQGFEMGVDAYWSYEQFSSRMLEARSRSLLRLQGHGPGKRLIPHLNLLIDSERYTISINEQVVSLTLTEFKVLRELACGDSPIVSRAEIESHVSGGGEVRKRSLDVHICAIRKKIEPLGLKIDSIRGVGYRLSPCRVEPEVLNSGDGTT